MCAVVLHTSHGRWDRGVPSDSCARLCPCVPFRVWGTGSRPFAHVRVHLRRLLAGGRYGCPLSAVGPHRSARLHIEYVRVPSSWQSDSGTPRLLDEIVKMVPCARIGSVPFGLSCWIAHRGRIKQTLADAHFQGSVMITQPPVSWVTR